MRTFQITQEAHRCRRHPSISICGSNAPDLVFRENITQIQQRDTQNARISCIIKTIEKARAAARQVCVRRGKSVGRNFKINSPLARVLVMDVFLKPPSLSPRRGPSLYWKVIISHVTAPKGCFSQQRLQKAKPPVFW